MYLRIFSALSEDEEYSDEYLIDSGSDGFDLNISADYNQINELFEGSIKNVKTAKNIISFLDKIKSAKYMLSSMLNNLARVQFGKIGSLTSKYYNKNSESVFNFDCVIPNKSKNYEIGTKQREEAEKEFERKFMNILFMSTYKACEDSENIENCLRQYIEKNPENLMKGISPGEFAQKYVVSKFGSATNFNDDWINVLAKNVRELKNIKGKPNLFSKAKALLSKTGENIQEYITDVRQYTPERIGIQLYEKIDGEKYYFIKSDEDTYYKNYWKLIDEEGNEIMESKSKNSLKNKKDDLSKNNPNKSYFIRKKLGKNLIKSLASKGAFQFMINNITLMYESMPNTFVKHSHREGEIYMPDVVKFKITISTNRGLLLNEWERIFSGYK